MTRRRLIPIGLLAPAGIIVGFFFLGGLGILVYQSFQTYTPGRITHLPYIFTFKNYVEYFGTTRVYFGFIADSLRLAGIATAFSVALAYPLAYRIARAGSVRVRKLFLTILIVSFFTNGIVKVFSWLVVLGDNGLVNSVLVRMGLGQTRFLGTDVAVILGLVYGLFSISALALIGPIRNIDPSVEEAALNLGANKFRTFMKVTLPLSMPGIVAAALLSYALGVSAFVIPVFLGKGSVLMMANIIFSRYSDTFNFPAGSAMSVVLLTTTLFIAYGLSKILARWVKGYT